MRISDWSSDVCSSDLLERGNLGILGLAAGGAWDESARGLLEHLHIAARPFGERIVRSERALERRADVLLVLAERRHRGFVIARHESLHLVAIEADQGAQEIDQQHRLAARFSIHDDMRKAIVCDADAATGE